MENQSNQKYLVKQITVMALYVGLAVFTLFHVSNYIALAERGASRLSQLLQFEQLPLVLHAAIILFFLVALVVGLRKARQHSWQRIILNFVLVAIVTLVVIAVLNFLSPTVAEVAEIAEEIIQ